MSIISDKHFSYDVPNTYAMGNFPIDEIREHHREEEDSPYEEVRASVSNTDDPDMPVNTLRMWAIGLFLTVFGAGMNTFFIFRNPYRLILSNAIMYVSFKAAAADLRLYPANWPSASLHSLSGSLQHSFYPYGHGPFQDSWEGCRYP